jgi:hypothetical protein
MFYRMIGMAVWKLARASMRRYRRRLRAVAALGVLSVAIAGYLAARSGD